ncbi:MAG: enoyl-CoA hydratase/isomerase family protein [Bacteroidia bacterium]
MYKEIVIPPFLNHTSIRALTRRITQAEKENARFLILKGTDEVFCNGLDLGWITKNPQGNNLNNLKDWYSSKKVVSYFYRNTGIRKDMQAYGAFLRKLQTGYFVSIALVSGSASGGGMGIVCACDYVIADETSTFSLPEGLLGLIPGMILPSLLNRLTTQQIKKMVLTGKKYPSNTALQWGIADEVAKSDELHATLTKALVDMKSCQQKPIGKLKQLLYNSHLNKDDLAQQGMDVLSAKLKDTEVSDRLKNLAEFMAD